MFRPPCIIMIIVVTPILHRKYSLNTAYPFMCFSLFSALPNIYFMRSKTTKLLLCPVKKQKDKVSLYQGNTKYIVAVKSELEPHCTK